MCSMSTYPATGRVTFHMGNGFAFAFSVNVTDS